MEHSLSLIFTVLLPEVTKQNICPFADCFSLWSLTFNFWLWRAAAPRKAAARTTEARGAASREHGNVMSIYVQDDDDMGCWYWGGWQSDSQKSRLRGGGLGG